MPIPKPMPDEREDDYVGRCMEAIGGEYKGDEDQAVAICHATFKEQRKKEMNEQLLEAVGQRQAKNTEFGYGILTADRYIKNVREAVGLDCCYKFAATRTVSWDDVMRKAARTLVYSNPDMVTEEIEYSKRAGSSLKQYEDIELPKNCLMVFRHVLTTPRKDRDGDVLRTKGAKVDPKLLLLWNHVHTIPVGKMLQVAEHNEKKLSLISCIVDELPMAHDCAVMIDNGMGRFSHGFRAIQFNKIKARDGSEAGGFDVTDFEIMEASLVTVPSNTDAEVEEVMLGLVEGGKLTSPLMKEYGRSIRAKRPDRISLPIDLKITLNGKEIEPEEKANPQGINQYTVGGGGGGNSLSGSRDRLLSRIGSHVSRGEVEDAEQSVKDGEEGPTAAAQRLRRGTSMDDAGFQQLARHLELAKEIIDANVKGTGVEAGGGSAGEGKDAAGLAEKADGGAAADKAEEATTDEKVKCPECGAMMARSVGAECPKCGYVLKKGDVEEDEVEEDELEEKSTQPEGTKFGRAFSRKNLTALKEVHADVEELDRGDHVLSVRGREITKGCRTKLKAMIDEHDIPDEGGVEEGKSFGVEDAMAVLIAEATPAQRNTIRKAFDAIEQVEQKNASARQYRAFVKGS